VAGNKFEHGLSNTAYHYRVDMEKNAFVLICGEKKVWHWPPSLEDSSPQVEEMSNERCTGDHI